MNRLRSLAVFFPAVLVALVLPWSSSPRAEVAVYEALTNPSAKPTTILMAISEGPDPIDSKIWTHHTNSNVANVLNPGGELRGDGDPCIAWYRSTGRPVAVWAYRSGVDTDVAFSEWNGSQWTPVWLLAETPASELDPHVFIDDSGAVHVVWWAAGAKDRVLYRVRDALSGSWAPVVEITSGGESGRRPSTAVFDGVVWVAYERTASGIESAQEIVAVAVNGQAIGPGMTVAGSQRTERLDVTLHVEDGALWVDWKDDDQEMPFSEYSAGSWSAPSTEPWNDSSWLGVEQVRASVRTRVLQGDPPTTP